MDQKSSFVICPRVSARFLHCFCTVSRDAMGTLICKIRQRVQKLHSEKARCSAQKQRKLETSKIKVFCPVGSFNQRARDSSSLERTKIPRRIARFLVGFFLFSSRTVFARWVLSMSDDVGRCIALQSVPFFASGEQCQAQLCLHFRVGILAQFQKSRHGDGGFATDLLRDFLRRAALPVELPKIRRESST